MGKFFKFLDEKGIESDDENEGIRPGTRCSI
jgi:hypothetical protein